MMDICCGVCQVCIFSFLFYFTCGFEPAGDRFFFYLLYQQVHYSHGGLLLMFICR